MMTPTELIAAFDVLAEAPDGVLRLRELILQLAVRGWLVPQEPQDEPASELLVRMAAEKVRLIESGQIRKAQAVSPSPEDLVPFDVPDGWAWSRMDALVQFVTSGSRGWAEYYSSTGPMFLRIGNLDYSTTDLDLTHMQHVSPPEGAEGSRTAVAPGDILISITGDTGMVGLVPEAFSEAYINQHIALCRPLEDVAPAFLARVCTSSLVRDQLWGLQRGIKNSLGLDDIRMLRIPIPPLAEQQRIVARVDELMGLLDRLEAARNKREATRAAARDSVLAALREADSPEAVDAAWTRFAQRMDDLLCDPADIAPLRHAVLQLAVRGRLVQQDPKDEPVADLAQTVVEKRRTSRGQSVDSSVEPLFSVPSNWRWFRMDAVTDLASGVTKGRSLVGRKTTALPYLRVANVQAGFLDLKVIKTIDVPNDEIDEGLLLRCGDVLLTEGGDWDKLGRSAIWNGEVSPCTHQNHVFRARPVGGMNSRWISMFTNSPDGRTYFQSCAKRTTNLASINMTQLRACPVPVPPVAEQDRIVARVDELTGLLDRIEQRLAATNAAQAAFAGAAVHHVVA